MSVPFANGTEGSAWQATWCDRCLHDHAIHSDNYVEGNWDPTGCPIFVRTILYDETPKVWQPYTPEFWRYLPAHLGCRGFEPCEPCGVPVTLRPPIYGEDQ